MALTIILQPVQSEVFKRLKQSFDPYFYSESIGDAGMPALSELICSGSGALAGETLQLYKNDALYSYNTAGSDGTFNIPFVPDYNIGVNHLQVIGGTSGQSNDLYVDTYNYLIPVYILAQEFLKLLQSYGQDKQDIFVSDVVGDSVDGGIFKWEKDFSNTFSSIKGHMPLPVPASWWDSDYQALLRRSILIAKNALVQSSLFNLKAVFKNAGVDDIFFYFQENFRWLDLNGNKIYVDEAEPNILKIKYKDIRMKTSIETIEAIEIPTTNDMKGNYVWIYVDETLTAQGGLSVQTSLTQPIPRIYEDCGVTTNYGIPGHELIDSSKNWVVNQWQNKYVKAGTTNYYKILSNDATSLTLNTTTDIATISTDYEILFTKTYNATYVSEDTGPAATGGIGSITDSTKAWEVDKWKNCMCKPTGYDYYLILNNTATALSLDTDDNIFLGRTGNYTIYSTEVFTDVREEDLTLDVPVRSKTGSPAQRYVVLDPPIYLLDGEICCFDNYYGTQIDGIKVINRSILALGTYNSLDIDVAYSTYQEPKILCVLRVDASGNIASIHRKFCKPNHIHSMRMEQIPDVFVFAKMNSLYFSFDEVKQSEIKQALLDILDRLNPIFHPMYLFISATSDEQKEITEDEVVVNGHSEWGNYFKGYICVSKT